MDNPFPLGVAKGEAFCNREAERMQIKKSIQHCRHVMLESPRRYGKTSLVQKVLEENHIPFEKIDLSLATSAKAVNDYLISATERLLIKLQPSYKKAFELSKQLLKHLTPKLIIDDIMGAKIELTVSHEKNIVQQIHSTLQSLDKVAKAADRKAVIFIDEFQQIATLTETLEIEAAIRSAAQDFEAITLIFSGSNRRLLQLMFDDRNRPFFQLCEKIALERISQTEYEKHLTKLSKKHWKTALKTEIINMILDITERHPYYVNFLCYKLWSLPTSPTDEDILRTWQLCLEEETHLLSKDLMSLTPTQRSILQLVMTQDVTQPTSKQVTQSLDYSNRTISKGFEELVAQDYLYRTDTGTYELINPLMKTYIRELLRQKGNHQ